MTRKVQRPVEEDRQVGVDLDDAAVVALIPVVAAPRLVVHVLQRERLAVGQCDVRMGAFAAGGDRRTEHPVHALGRDHERCAKSLVPLRQGATPRQRGVEGAEEPIEIGSVVRRGHGVVQGGRLFVEGHALAGTNCGPHVQGARLCAQRAQPPVDLHVVGGHRPCVERATQRGDVPAHRRERRGGLRDLAPQPFGSVVRIHRIRIVDTERQHQSHVVTCETVNRVGHGAWSRHTW